MTDDHPCIPANAVLQRRRKISAALLGGFALAAATLAQPTPPAPAAAPPTPPSNEVIELTPFIVDTTKDRGYQAANTLSGSRLNSSLHDTPASVSVWTKEFIQDVGLTELNE